MKRSNAAEVYYQVDTPELINRTAFHEAGHAAGIYLYNQQKGLPPVYFQVRIKGPHSNQKVQSNAKIDGGCLIQTLPVTTLEYKNDSQTHNKDIIAFHRDCLAAFEADIINLLVGPLAEARYVSICDNEPFNFHLMDLNSLNYYGGASDLERVNEYLDCFITQSSQREEKISELFKIAYDFVNKTDNWKAITTLANYILDNHKTIIDYEEAALVINGKCPSH